MDWAQKSVNQGSKDTDKLKYDVYLEERKLLIDAEREGSRSFDKAILTLAAGALGLSIAFIEKIIPVAQARTTWSLIASWISFGLSIVFILFSFLTSQWACLRQRDILDNEWLNSAEPQKSPWNYWTSTTYVLNIASILSFVIGIIFLCYFGFVNLPTEDTMKKKDYGFTPQKAPAKSVEKGFTPPKAPARPFEEGYVPPKPPAVPAPAPPKTTEKAK